MTSTNGLGFKMIQRTFIWETFNHNDNVQTVASCILSNVILVFYEVITEIYFTNMV